MKNLSKLTVIIPSMNRQKLGLSTMNYWCLMLNYILLTEVKTG